MVDPQQALYEVLFAQLNGYSALWGGRVQPLTIASSSLTKPYCVFFAAAGGRDNVVPTRNNARWTVSVKAVALEMTQALGARAAISAALHNAGRQDVNPRLPEHAEWDVLTVTEDRVIWLEEKFEGSQSIYHAGYQYDITMESK